VKQRGLTLIEMLVVIVITGLVASLVVQGIGQGLGLFRRVSADQGLIYRELVSLEWLRQTVATAVPNRAEADEFIGTPEQLQMLTFRPLLGPEGVQTPIEWAIDGEGGLLYREGEQTIAVDIGAPVVGMEFQDAQLAWHSRWPLDESRDLPERVRFTLADDEFFLVTLVTQKVSFFYADDLMFERD
jgi:prepilin-type N-terminal cleavage/methylation domain-containing protein